MNADQSPMLIPDATKTPPWTACHGGFLTLPIGQLLMLPDAFH